MIRKLFLSAVMTFMTAPAFSQSTASDLVLLETRQATQGWEAVGRLDVASGGFCTAALIRDRLLLTAAHCVYDSNDKLIAPSEFLFRAGLRNGRADATRRIVSVVPHPDFISDSRDRISVENIGRDIAVLELAQPIRYSGVEPFPIAGRPFRGDEVTIVSYGRDRAEAPSLQESCSILSRLEDAVVMDCDVIFGSSGSPVFQVRNGRALIVSVVSAIAQADGSKVSFGTSLQEPLQELLAEFAVKGPAKPGGEQRLIGLGERNDTGAKFVSTNN